MTSSSLVCCSLAAYLSVRSTKPPRSLSTDRRTQVHHSDFVSGSLSSSSGRSGPLDAESVLREDDDEQDLIEEVPRSLRVPSRSAGDDALLENIQWDEDLTPGPSTEQRSFDLPTPTVTSPRYPMTPSSEDIPTPRAGERTPLFVRQTTSTTVLGRAAPQEQTRSVPQYSAVQRRISRSSIVSKGEPKLPQHTGQSTFAQTVGIVLLPLTFQS